MTGQGPLDEMADGYGQAKPYWRPLLSILFALGHETLSERTRILDRTFAEEGITAILPGERAVNWRCDPIPLLISAAEFAQLETALAQRARLMELVLADLYGPRTLLSEGLVPPDLVYGNPSFLRPCRTVDGRRRDRYLTMYAADMIRGPDGVWRVLADRTGQAQGLAYALENRRILARVLPELFQSQKIRQLRQFLEATGDALQTMCPDSGAGVALLSGGHADPLWFEHVLLSREMSIGLVESGDLTLRNGQVFLKTLRGLQRIGVLLRRQEGHRVDPLELAPGIGVPGLLEAIRGGTVRMVNDAGSGLAEAPGLAAFLPALARRLLGEELQMPSQATLWLGEGAVVRTVLRDLEGWLVRKATDGDTPPVVPMLLSAKDREDLADRIAADPAAYAVSEAPSLSVAPCVGANGLEPKPIAMRMFLSFDGERWRAFPGGLARALSEEDALAGRLPRTALSKDVWVIAEENAGIQGTLGITTPVLGIRRTAGDLPSRVADNFYWLGRYLERLEEAARLQRAMIARILRPSPTPREVAEMQILVTSLTSVGMMEREDASVLGVGMLGSAVMRAFRLGGGMRVVLGDVARQVDQLRDRLTGEMHTVLTRSLRALGDQMRHLPPDQNPRALEHASVLTADILEFAATVAGLAAENMVRGGGRLFLDFGRRVERAQAIAAELAQVLEQPGTAHPGRVEAGLRMALELRDSVITYRTRYLAVLQPAPALDLILADEGNPRGLAFQLVAARELLREIAEDGDSLLVSIDPLLAETAAIIQDVLQSPDQMAATARLPLRLRKLQEGIAAMADRVSRRYFTLLPVARSLGVESDLLRGAA
ncbi:MAG TPA: circularly permuted type 2 ATP-grasp protein [Rhodopila sp.]|uniref:circularly permuted type 2 ATP-grasp protein n=1 Tax=Rhodopila sp. TaxID=2480087 RepID=UPI002C752A78|nr:circularly permuted type 2 ATP-grasp protein [Rhodopila sp.]HVY15167.1 circularly permuted type 2 ATP-grasp protein [Rhodopila sp.]